MQTILGSWSIRIRPHSSDVDDKGERADNSVDVILASRRGLSMGKGWRVEKEGWVARCRTYKGVLKAVEQAVNAVVEIR